MDLVTIEQLWARHDWAGYAGLIVFLGLVVWKRYAPGVWDSLPGWTQFAIPFLLVGGTSFSETLAKDQAATVIVALFNGLGAGLGLVGTYHGMKRTPLLGRAFKRRPLPPSERTTDPPASQEPANDA